MHIFRCLGVLDTNLFTNQATYRSRTELQICGQGKRFKIKIIGFVILLSPSAWSAARSIIRRNQRSATPSWFWWFQFLDPMIDCCPLIFLFLFCPCFINHYTVKRKEKRQTSSALFLTKHTPRSLFPLLLLDAVLFVLSFGHLPCTIGEQKKQMKNIIWIWKTVVSSDHVVWLGWTKEKIGLARWMISEEIKSASRCNTNLSSNSVMNWSVSRISAKVFIYCSYGSSTLWKVTIPCRTRITLGDHRWEWTQMDVGEGVDASSTSLYPPSHCFMFTHVFEKTFSFGILMSKWGEHWLSFRYDYRNHLTCCRSNADLFDTWQQNVDAVCPSFQPD